MPNYPDGCPSAYHFEDDVRCKACGHSWTVEFVRDLGMCDPVNDSDMTCGECGSDDTE